MDNHFIFYLFYPIVTILLKISDAVAHHVTPHMVPAESSSEWVSSEKEIQFLIEHINEKG